MLNPRTVITNQSPLSTTLWFLFLQRRSRRNLALKGSSKNISDGNNSALSQRRLSLEKAQSRKSLGSQKALDSRQTLESHGVADGHQKPSGTTMSPLADVETGQVHLDSAMETADMGAARDAQPAPSNAGKCCRDSALCQRSLLGFTVTANSLPRWGTSVNISVSCLASSMCWCSF